MELIQPKDVLSLAQYRPSPVKFTNQRPDQFPVKPKPERVPPISQTYDSKACCTVVDSTEGCNQKDESTSKNNTEIPRPMLSLETLKDFTDFGREEVKIFLLIKFDFLVHY